MKFIPPQLVSTRETGLEQTLLQREVDRLNAELKEQLSAAELAAADRLRQAQLLEDLEKSVQQSEAENQQIQQRLAALEAQAQAMPNDKRQLLVRKAGDTPIDLDESATRRLIDQQLREVGWEVDTELLTYARGVRPEKGRNLAIAEYPIGRRSADYVLFIGLEAVAVIEAKRRYKNVQSGALEQAINRYAKKFPDGVVPFAFATNGRPYQAQIKALSGIWFQDLRRETNLSRAIGSWLTPEELKAMLRQDLDVAETKLAATSFEVSFKLRDYQKQAIQAVEAAIVKQQRSILLAMATGTGKTRR